MNSKRVIKSGMIFLVSFFILSLTSCENEFEDFEGAWNGTFQGDDSGTWAAFVEEDGEVIGTYQSENISFFTIPMSGTVDEQGNIDAQSDIGFVEIRFSGKLNSGMGSGSWENLSDSLSGGWSGVKQ